MKIKLYKNTLTALFAVLILACNKNILNVENLSAIDPSLTWNDPAVANSYLANLYNRVMPNGWTARSGALFGGLPVDDYRGAAINDNTIQLTGHSWSGSFEDLYTDIRQINILLQETAVSDLHRS